MNKFLSIILFILISMSTLTLSAQNFNDLINLDRYAEANKEAQKAICSHKRVVFMGNSITEGWAAQKVEFFSKHNFIGRGISGQTTSQMLSRFRRDVVELSPYAVIISGGTNDIAENTGAYDPQFTLGNIKSMADIARANNIEVILASVLPAKGFRWIPEITDSIEKIEALNKEIKAYALEMNFLYIDYHSQLKDETGGLKSHFGEDGVHPNAACYELMEEILIGTLNF